MSLPLIVLLFSGKRKSGKDFIANKLKTLLAEKCTIIRISEPLKRYYAQAHKLDFKELMTDTDYKEKHRREMIEWSDTVRKSDPGHFCRAACDSAEPTPVWVVCDIRRKTDVKWFKDIYSSKIKLIRVTADESIRAERGWVFTQGCDDVQSECDLDDFTEWDLVISNNNVNDLKDGIEKIVHMIGEK